MTNSIIITHDGRFHADEVLACVVLKRMNPMSTIIRTRDLEVIHHYVQKQQIIAIVDVYGQYIPDKCYFDHHQRGFETYIDGVLCSSAGLVFKHFYFDILKAYNIETRNKARACREIYYKYFRAVDAIDNGVDIRSVVAVKPNRNSFEYDLGLPELMTKGNEQRIYMRTISSMVAEYGSFEEAFSFVNTDFNNFMNGIRIWINKYDKVKEYLDNMMIHNSVVEDRYKKDILLTDGMDNIGNLVCEIEKELGLDIKYIVDKQANTYKVYAVPECVGGFRTKRPLCEKWRGLRDDELCEVSEIEGCVFVHSTGFLGINSSLSGALKMCYKSLE